MKYDDSMKALLMRQQIRPKRIQQAHHHRDNPIQCALYFDEQFYERKRMALEQHDGPPRRSQDQVKMKGRLSKVKFKMI
jgi:hypothetical protein